MKLYPIETINEAIELRLQGNTYQEINEQLKISVPKSTYSYWFRTVAISPEKQNLLSTKIAVKLVKARRKAVDTNRAIRKAYLQSLDRGNFNVSRKIMNVDTAKIALAMLCLGEASKSTRCSGFYLGNSDPKIIVLFIKLLKLCFPINPDKFRFTIQCRADQDVEELEKYWRKIIVVENCQFYKTRIDPRSVGKPTLNKDYRGVLRVDYIDKRIQLELESLANMIYNQVVRLGP